MGSRDKHRGKRLQKIMKCFCSGDMVKEEETMVPNSSESLATKDYFSSTASGISGQDGQVERRLDSGNIEQAESSLRESGILNYEEARALLGRYEYQEGNIEAALHVFEGINIAALTPKIKVFLAKSTERPKRRSQNYTTPPMSIHTAGLLLEAIFLKAKCLQVLARFEGQPPQMP